MEVSGLPLAVKMGHEGKKMKHPGHLARTRNLVFYAIAPNEQVLLRRPKVRRKTNSLWLFLGRSCCIWSCSKLVFGILRLLSQGFYHALVHRGVKTTAIAFTLCYGMWSFIGYLDVSDSFASGCLSLSWCSRFHGTWRRACEWNSGELRGEMKEFLTGKPWNRPCFPNLSNEAACARTYLAEIHHSFGTG